MLIRKRQFKTLKNIKPKKKITKKALLGKPQRKGICLKVWVMRPKKPNSALRQIAKLFHTRKNTITCHIPGETHTLQSHSHILYRGCRVRDLPGVSYRGIRGVYDLKGVPGRMNGRSKYGTKDFFK